MSGIGCARWLVALAAVTGAGGCHPDQRPSSGEAPSTGEAPKATAESAPGAASSARAAAAPSDWRSHLEGGLGVRDSRGGNAVSSCWNGATRLTGACPSQDPHLRAPSLRASSWDALHELVSCAADRLPARPKTHTSVAVAFTLDRSGRVTASLQDQSVLERIGLAACVERAAQALAPEAASGPGELSVNLGYDYPHWCEDAAQEPGVERDRPVIRVRDVKEVPEWNLVPEPGGYVFAACSSPERYHFKVEGERLAVTDERGHPAGAVERDGTSFVMKDGAGAEIRRGALPVAEPNATPVSGRWSADMYWVAPASIPARAAAAIRDFDLRPPWNAALLAFVLAGLDVRR